MKYGFGTWVITDDNRIGIVVEYHEYDQTYFVKHDNGDGQLYKDNQLKEWHGCW